MIFNLLKDMFPVISAPVIPDVFTMIKQTLFKQNSILPVHAKCLACGHHFTVSSLGFIHRCPKCGSRCVRVNYMV